MDILNDVDAVDLILTQQGGRGQRPSASEIDTLDIDALDLMAPRTNRAKAASPVRPAPSSAEPDAPSMIERVGQSIRGKKDARYQGVPTIAEVMLKEGNHKLAPELWAWTTMAEDKDMVDVYKGMLGKRFLGAEADANGFPVIVYKGQDGKDARAYVNAPGLDTQDVLRAGYGALPFMATGAVTAARTAGSGLLRRMTAQGAVAGATSVSQDVAGVATGVTSPDLERSATKAGLSAVGGVAGEGLAAGAGAIWRRLFAEPKLFDKAAGRLTPEGEAAVRQAGLDPQQIAGEAAEMFSREMARIGDPKQALSSASSREFGIRRSAGEALDSLPQRFREQQIAGGTFGEGPADSMRLFREGQKADISMAVRGGADDAVPPGIAAMSPKPPSIAERLAPDRVGTPTGKADMGSNILANTQLARAAADSAEDAAWKAVPRVAATDEMRALLPDTIAKRASDLMVDKDVTPMAARMTETLGRFVRGEAPEKVDDILPSTPVGDINQMRKSLLGFYKAAQSNEDKRASRMLYDAYNDWIEDAAKLSPDPFMAGKMKVARSISRRVHESFDGPAKSGASFIMKDILKNADTPELVVNALFSGPSKAEIKAGAIPALRQLKQAYETFLDQAQANAAWNDIRLAYWMRVVEAKTGDVLGPQGLSTAIKTAVNNQKSLARELYTPDEMGTMMRLAGLLDDIAKRDPNKSGSAIGIGTLLNDVGSALMTMIGGNTLLGKVAVGTIASPVRSTIGNVRVQQATGGGAGVSVPSIVPPLAGPAAGAAATYQNR